MMRIDDGAGAGLPRIHVVNDDDGLRASLGRLAGGAALPVQRHRGLTELLQSLDSECAGCIVIVLEASLPAPDGVGMYRALLEHRDAPPVIFVTSRDDVETSVSLMRAGAFDLLLRPLASERLMSAIHRAMRADAQRRPLRRELRQLKERFARLTAIERRIFVEVARDRMNKQIAAEIGECERRVKEQRASMMDKLGLANLPQLVRAARLLEHVGCVSGSHRQ